MDLWDGTSSRRSAGSQRAPDRIDYDKIVEQIRLAQNGFNGVDPSATLQNIGTEETISGLTVTEYGDGAMHKTVFTFAAFALASADGATPATDGAWGTDQLYTFPTGSKLLQASGFDLDITASNLVTTGFTTTSDFDIGVGSVALTAASAFSLTGTLSDYGDATVALIASASTGDTATVSTPAVHTATGLHLNVRTVDDADHGTSAGRLLLTGSAFIIWSMLK